VQLGLSAIAKNILQKFKIYEEPGMDINSFCFMRHEGMTARKEIYLYIQDGFNFVMTSEAVMEDIHKELLFIRKKLEELEEIILPTDLPTEKLEEEELEEIRNLREESISGEHIKWDELKKKIL